MKNREITLDSLRSMVKFYIDSNDHELIENYTCKLLELSKDFDDGVKHIRPTVTFGNKTYYGKKLEIKDEKVFIDDEEIFEKEIGYSGDVVIDNNNVGGNKVTIKINGDLKANNIHTSGGLFCETLRADNIKIEKGILYATGDVVIAGGIECENIHATKVDAGKITCHEISSDAIYVKDELFLR